MRWIRSTVCRSLVFGVVVVATVLGLTGAVMACGGLVAANGAVNLQRTSTLAAYHDGVEHYVTSFEFEGGGGRVRRRSPLPGVPTNVERGGAWTLQRLEREQRHRPRGIRRRQSAQRGACRREVLQQVRIDSLDLTVLRAAGQTSQRGPRRRLPALAGCAGGARLLRQRSPYFLAAVFDATPPPRAGSRSATVRRCISRSRRPIRGCRCASSRPAQAGGRSVSTPTCTC